MGWDKKQTSRPTSFMMTTYFSSVLVLQTAGGRMLGKPLDSIQLKYLALLKLSPAIFYALDAGFSDKAVLLSTSGPSG